MKQEMILDIIHKTFYQTKVFNSQQLNTLIREVYPNVSNNTIAWRINQLKNEKSIYQVGRGLYSLQYFPEFVFHLNIKTKRFCNKIDKDKYSNLIIWDTTILDNLLKKNSGKTWIFILAQKPYLESLFLDLQQLNKPVFLNPNHEITTRYLLPKQEAVILMPMISQMPTMTQNSFTIPTIEAILVDIWLDFKQYFQPLGYDLNTLFEFSFNNYNINRSKLLRYAARRDKREIIEEFINNFNS